MRSLKLLFLSILFSANVNGQGYVYTVAGTGQYSSAGDGGQAINAGFKSPRGIWKDNGNLYVTENEGYRMRKIDLATGIISTIAGTGVLGSSGVGGPAVNAEIGHADDVWIDSGGNIYFGDGTNSMVRKIDPMGILHTVAGNGTWSHTGDGGDASLSTTGNPETLCIDSEGNLFIACPGIVRRIDHATNIITTVAGTGIGGYSGDGGPAINAEMSYQVGSIVADASDNLYFAEYGNNVIRKVDVNGIITTFAGTAAIGFSGDGGLATNAQFNYPYGLAIDLDGNLLVADANNSRIRKIDLSTNIITTIAGGGTDTTEGASAITAELGKPTMIIVDDNGDIYYTTLLINKVKVIRIGATSVVSSAEREGILIYPNPATEDLTIKTDKQYTSYTISNSIGQVMVRSTLSNKNASIDIAKLPAGVYSIKLEGDTGNAVKSFVKM